MLVWDILFAVFVAFPVLTGGVWLKGKGYHVELTEAGPGCVVLALWLWQRGGAGASRACAFGLAVWRRWCDALALAPRRSLALAWLAAALTWFLTAIVRHRAFGSGLADLGIFTNAISNVSTLGWPLSSLKDGASLLSDHQIFLLYPLGWIFRLWPSPLFLLALQSLVLTSGGLALYLLGRQRLGNGHPVVSWLPFLFWLAGPLRAAHRFDFHPETFMLPLFLFAAFLLQESSWPRRVAGFALFGIALAAKESAGPVACGIGLAWLLGAGPAATRGFTRAAGAAFVALGIGAFVFDSRLVPGLFGVTYAYSDLYAPLPATLSGLALAPFTQPAEFFGRLLTLSRAKFLLGTLLPLAFFPLLAPASLLAALPGYLMLFLTNGEHRISLGYHYAIEPMTGLLFALPAALASPFARRHAGKLLPIAVVATMISYGHSEPYFWRVYSATPHQAWVRDEVLPLVARERSVMASYAFVPHLAVRRWVNQLGFHFDDQQRLVDCVLVDPSVNNTPYAASEVEGFRLWAEQAGYVEEVRCGSFHLLRNHEIPSCLTARAPVCPEGR